MKQDHGVEGTASRRPRRLTEFVLVLIALVWMIPGFGLLITSFRSADEYARSGWWTALYRPGELTISNYVEFLSNGNLLGTLGSTLLIAVPATLIPISLATTAGYALAWIPFKGRKAVYLSIVSLLVVPFQLALLPALELFGTIKLSGLPAIWLFHTAFGLPLGVFLMHNFFAGIPKSIIEAARIDGAGEGSIFANLALPNALPGIASLAIFQFTWTWNDLLVALVFAGNRTPITVAIQQRLNDFSTGIEVIGPGVLLGAVAPLLLFFAFQRHFETAMKTGALH